MKELGALTSWAELVARSTPDNLIHEVLDFVWLVLELENVSDLVGQSYIFFNLSLGFFSGHLFLCFLFPLLFKLHSLLKRMLCGTRNSHVSKPLLLINRLIVFVGWRFWWRHLLVSLGLLISNVGVFCLVDGRFQLRSLFVYSWSQDFSLNGSLGDRLLFQTHEGECEVFFLKASRPVVHKSKIRVRVSFSELSHCKFQKLLL